MPRHATLLCCLAFAACGPRSHYHDYSTPEGAVRSFVEAGRVGDTDSVRRSVVVEERDGALDVDYRDLGEYRLVIDSLIEHESAVVMLETGPVSAPIACRKQRDGWKVSLQDSLRQMMAMHQQLLGSPPR